MHDVDRTQQFMEAGYQELPGYEITPAEYGGPFETGPYEFGQYETGQYETGPYETAQYEYQGEIQGEALRDEVTGEINVNTEIALAAELLSVSNEEELNQFLGKLVRGIGRGFKKFARSGLGKTLFSAIRPLAKAALPTLGGALGSFIPIPGVGTALGSAAGKAVAGALEFQGMSAEDRDFEIARRVIRTAIESANHVESLPQGEIYGEVVMEDELWNAVKAIGGRLLPGAVSLLTSGISGGATAGAQGTGGLSGGLSVRSPGGWQVNVGGQAGGQVTSGAAVGLNQPTPSVPFQPSPASQVLPRPYQSGPVGPAPSGGGARWQPRGGVCPPSVRMHGRWIRRGRAIIVLGLC